MFLVVKAAQRKDFLRLDEIDRRILRAMQSNARLTSAELADKVGLSTTPCWNRLKQPETYTLDEWREVLDINLTSAFLCSQAVYPHMVKAGDGKIVNIGSMLSIFGMPLAVPYGASKGDIVQMGLSLAGAWGKENIQVNAILPGWIVTDLTATARTQIEGLNERVMTRTPAKR